MFNWYIKTNLFYRSNLLQHLKNHERILDSIHQCDDCDIGFDSVRALRLHRTNQHNEVVENLHDCDVCDVKFINAADLNVHIAAEHDTILEKCTQCNEEFTSQRALDEHIIEHELGLGMIVKNWFTLQTKANLCIKKVQLLKYKHFTTTDEFSDFLLFCNCRELHFSYYRRFFFNEVAVSFFFFILLVDVCISNFPINTSLLWIYRLCISSNERLNVFYRRYHSAQIVDVFTDSRL